GPSLNNKDIIQLKDEITFAANKIYLSFEKTKFKPSYYFVTDELVYSQNYTKIESLKLNKYFSSSFLLNNKRMQKSVYFSLNYKSPSKFSINPYSGMHSGSTVVFVMIEFAIYMGIKELYIIGLDFSFKLPSKIQDKESLIAEGEVNHFHKDYRKVGEKWTKPNMNLQRDAFLKAKEYAKSHGIKIYNASRETKLDVFEKINLDVLLNKKEK
ncbi:DUF115 domain-containing protein, partial [Arcobacteraceae bacterium]|nr:DUF115 domain-containing protein [Arcobacteraceae bacterium]